MYKTGYGTHFTGILFWAWSILGLLFHFIIAFGLAIFYFWLYPKVKWLGRNKILAGILYGIFAWLVTTQLIVSLSLLTQPKFDLAKAVVPILILVAFIGLPISLMANKRYLYKK